MMDLDEPQLSNRIEEPSKLESSLFFSVPDKKGILLELNKEDGELAVMNCSIAKVVGWPKPFLYRTELSRADPDPGSFRSISRKWGNPVNPFGKYSVIDLRWLRSPTEFTDERKKTILFPTEGYEEGGCEDPRITLIDNVFYITYVAFDGLNARVAYATTQDFDRIEKHGVISPQIPLEEAVELVGEESYKQIWKSELKNREFKKKRILFPMDKDAFIIKIIKNQKFRFYHRLGNYMQVAEVDNLGQLKDQNFWRDYLKNIDRYTLMKNTSPWISDEWASERIGWGSQFFELGDKTLDVWHGIDGNLNYSCSFLEERDGKIVSVIKNPLFVSSDEDIFCEKDFSGKILSKRVIFCTETLEYGDHVFVYFGKGDRRIGYYATNKHWLYRELNEPSNRVESAVILAS